MKNNKIKIIQTISKIAGTLCLALVFVAFPARSYASSQSFTPDTITFQEYLDAVEIEWNMIAGENIGICFYTSGGG